MPFAFDADDVWTLFHSCSFDFSVWEMFGALLYGGRLVVVPRDVARDPALFAELVVRERVTVLNQTPSAFYEFAQEILRERSKPLALRYVIFGGEALQPSRLRAFKDAYPAVKLINMYGITETTVHVTVAEVSDTDIAENLSNIGRPIPTTTAYLFDEKLRLVPVGVPAEIFVGGQGVGRGYLGAKNSPNSASSATQIIPGNGFTVRATSHGTCRTEAWFTWGASTIRCRSVVSALNSAKSRPISSAIPLCATSR